MKILMLTPYLPYPPASGGQIRTYNLLKYLSKNNEITLISLYKQENEKKYADNLKKYCKEMYFCKRPEKPWQFKNVFNSIFSFKPFLVVRNYSSQASETITNLLNDQKFDVIHAETFYVMPHIPETNIPILLVEQTIEFKVYQHFIKSLPVIIRGPFYLDILKLKYWERYYWQKAKVVAAVSDSDQKIIASLEPKINPVVIPNGAGDEMFLEKFSKADLSKPKLLFMGNFFWLQNIEAAKYLTEQILPDLKKEIPDCQVIIAGQNASQKLPIQNNSNVKVIDLEQNNTKQVKDLYQSSTVFIAPIFGPGGTRLKILASIASGLPVIATKTGIEGLEMQDKKHVLVANNPKAFVVNIKLLSSNTDLYNNMRSNAYKLAKEKYSWSGITKKLEQVYKKIAA